MKKNLKKIFALTCVFTMLTSTVCFGAETATANSSIENDNSTTPTCLDVVLPSIDDRTYDFTIDPDGLLAEYDRDGDADGIEWADNKSVYFSTVGTPATATASASGDNVFIKSKSTISLSDFYTVVKGAVTTTTFDALELKYYVWQPSTAVAGEGKFTTITGSNIETFFDITWNTSTSTNIDDIVLKPNYDTGSASEVCSGLVYVDTYTEATTDLLKAEVAKYITATVSDSTTTLALTDAGADKLYTAAASSTTGYAAVTNENINTTITYTAGTTLYTDTSSAAKVVNKSTFPVAVSVNLSLTGTHGLTFSTTPDFAASDENSDDEAALYMAIVNGSNEAALTSDGVTAYYVIDGVDEDTATYTYKTEGTDAITGSNTYTKYVAPDESVTYKEVVFNITGVANTTGFDWDAYIEELNAAEPTISKPGIQVVYDFATLDEGKTTETVTGEEVSKEYTYSTVYTDEDDNTYTVVDSNTYNTPSDSPATTGWATVEEEEVVRTLTLSAGSLVYTFTENAPSGTLTSIKINGTARDGQVQNGNITYANNVLTIKSVVVTNFFSAAGDYTVVATINGVDYTFTYTK